MRIRPWQWCAAIALLATGIALAWRPVADRLEPEPTHVATPIAPTPAGSHGIGRAWVLLRDPARRDRPIGAWLYYPTPDPMPAGPVALPAPWAQAYRPSLERNLGKAAAAALLRVRWHGRDGAAVAPGRFPVLLFAHGANQLPTNYTALLEDLVARGYIVVAIVSPGVAPVALQSDGTFAAKGDSSADDIAEIARDIAFVRQALPGFDARGPLSQHMEMHHIAAFGHSMGGAAAVLAASRDATLRAAANLDGDYMGESGEMQVRGPVLYVTTQPPGMPTQPVSAWSRDRSEARRDALWARMSSGDRAARRVRMPGMAHSNFMDAALLAPGDIPASRRRDRFGSIDGATGLRRTADLLAEFFSSALPPPSTPRTSAGPARPSPSPGRSRP